MPVTLRTSAGVIGFAGVFLDIPHGEGDFRIGKGHVAAGIALFHLGGGKCR